MSKAIKQKRELVLTWKEAFGFCVAHISRKGTRPSLAHVAVKLSSKEPSVVLMAATDGYSSAFLELGINWMASTLPAIPAQLTDSWQYIDKDGRIYETRGQAKFPEQIRHIIPEDLEHKPGYGPHLGPLTFENLYKSMKAIKASSGLWYLAPQSWETRAALFKVCLERVGVFSAWLLAMPTRSEDGHKIRRPLEGL